MVTFKPIAEFCGVIEINENGEIRSLARNGTPEKILKQTVGTNGYLKVSFRVCGKSYTKNVHRLLAEKLICDGKEIKQVVDALRKVFKTKQTE